MTTPIQQQAEQDWLKQIKARLSHDGNCLHYRRGECSCNKDWLIAKLNTLAARDPRLPPQEPVRDKQSVGLYEKFNVRRTDGSDGPGDKHYQCSYFVLDLTHDPHAIPALRAYAQSCRADYPMLADDLDKLADPPARLPEAQK